MMTLKNYLQACSLFLLGSLITALSASATVLCVNNSPGSTAPYTDLITAHAVAQTGDTIYVEGSNTDYGSLTVTKRLVFIGPGYFTAENNCAPNSLSAVVDRFELDRTAANDANSGAAGTTLLGLNFSVSNLSYVDISVSNVTIAKCYLRGDVRVQEADVSDLHVIQNYCASSGVRASSLSPGLNNLVFANNIVEEDFRLVDNSTGSIHHNLFLDDRFEVISFSGEIRSNIATTTSTNNFTVSVTGSGNLSHNTAANGQFGTADNNNIAPANLLLVGPNGNSTDGQYQLLPNATQVKNNAHDGTDRGPFGGNLPYVLSGVPNIPYIETFTTNTPNFPSLPLQVTIQASSGN